MPDDIQKIIYKLELDDSGYIKGVESLSASTNKFSEVQNSTNKALQLTEAALKQQSESLQKAKRDLDSYIGTDEKYKQQLTSSFKQAQADNQKLSGLVVQARKEYEAATKAAQDFANTSAKATQLQQTTTGGKIPVQAPPSVASGLNAQIFNAINIPELTAQAEIVQRTKQEFDELRDSIQLAEERMKELNVTDAEFTALAPIVEQAKIALLQYDKAAAEAAGETKSFRTEITAANIELRRLEEQGKENTKEYQYQLTKVTQLTKAYNDQREKIRILSSQTRGLDFGKASVQAAISGFQAYTSISILAGGASEELQKKTLQLFAAMQLLSSLEQLHNTLKTKGVILTNLQSAAQATYTAVVGASTGVLRAFKIALAATGIGAVIFAIGVLVNKFIEHKEAIKKAREEQKLYNDVVEEGNKEVGKQIADLKILTQAARDVSLPMKERLEAVQALQKEFPDYFANLSKETILTGDITKATDELTKSLIAASRARAAKGKIDKIESDKLDLDFQKQKIINATTKESDKVKESTRSVVDFNLVAEKDKNKSTKELLKQQRDQDKQALLDIIDRRKQAALNDVKDKAEALDREEEFLTKFVGLDKLAKVVEEKDTKKDKTAKVIKAIDNEFEQEKAKLLARLAELRNSEAENIKKINDEFAAKLVVEEKRITQLLKDKKITGDLSKKLSDQPKTQAGQLFKISFDINEEEKNKQLAALNKKITDARKKLNDELNDLQSKNTQEQLNLLQDEFESRAKLIDFNEKKELADSDKNTKARLAAFELTANLIFGEDLENNQSYQDAKNIIVKAGEDEQTNIIIKASQDRQQLAEDSFKKSLDFFQNVIDGIDLIDDEESAKRIRELSNKFLSQKITFEQFKKDLDDIERGFAAKKRNRDLLIERAELSSLDYKLTQIEDKTSAHYKRILILRDKQAKKVAELDKADAKGDAEDKGGKEKPDGSGTSPAAARIIKWANAIGDLTQSVIAFWQKANKAEAAALERSISLQEKRVDAAQRIAARGNASYLKAEEDRLKELNVARENAARKQLGIDAALQASQVLVAITGAVAKIANPVPGAGIADTIASIAVIIGALATGYGIVKGLQGNQPKLKTGTKNLRRQGHPQGVDTIPAWLNEGEAVIPTEKNKAYHPTVAAIYDGTVPPEHLNNFVKNYHKVKGVPQVNYERIKDAAELHISSDGKMAVAISEQNKLIVENNDLQRQTLRAMKNMSVSANIDRDGVAIMVNEFIQQKKIDKKV